MVNYLFVLIPKRIRRAHDEGRTKVEHPAIPECVQELVRLNSAPEGGPI